MAKRQSRRLSRSVCPWRKKKPSGKKKQKSRKEREQEKRRKKQERDRRKQKTFLQLHSRVFRIFGCCRMVSAR